MARRNEEKNLVYYIPQNYEENAVTISGIKYRNLVEGIILLGIVVAILWFIPIAIKPKITIGIFAGGGLGILGIVGINGSSLSEYIISFIQFKLRPKTYVKKKLFVKENET